MDELFGGNVILVSGDAEIGITMDITVDGITLVILGLRHESLQVLFELIPRAPHVGKEALFACIGEVVLGGEVPAELDVGGLGYSEGTALGVGFEGIVDSPVGIAGDQFIADIADDGQDVGLERGAEVLLGGSLLGVVGTMDEDGCFTDKIVEKMEGVDGFDGAGCNVSNDSWINCCHNS